MTPSPENAPVSPFIPQGYFHGVQESGLAFPRELPTLPFAKSQSRKPSPLRPPGSPHACFLVTVQDFRCCSAGGRGKSRSVQCSQKQASHTHFSKWQNLGSPPRSGGLEPRGAITRLRAQATRVYPGAVLWGVSSRFDVPSAAKSSETTGHSLFWGPAL